MAELIGSYNRRLRNCYGDNIFVTLLVMEYIPWCPAQLFAYNCE